MADVLFLCVRENAPRAEALAEIFDDAGFSVGDVCAPDADIDDCGAVVIVVSPAATESRRFLHVAQSAVDAGKAVIVSFIETPPPQSHDNATPIFDLSEWNGRSEDAALDPLFDAVDRLVALANAELVDEGDEEIAPVEPIIANVEPPPEPVIADAAYAAFGSTIEIEPVAAPPQPASGFVLVEPAPPQPDLVARRVEAPLMRRLPDAPAVRAPASSPRRRKASRSSKQVLAFGIAAVFAGLVLTTVLPFSAGRAPEAAAPIALVAPPVVQHDIDRVAATLAGTLSGFEVAAAPVAEPAAATPRRHVWRARRIPDAKREQWAQAHPAPSHNGSVVPVAFSGAATAPPAMPHGRKPTAAKPATET